jgi:arsenate reductase (glutaredoxin)
MLPRLNKQSLMPHLMLFHNARCSKSRQTLALLEQQGIDIDIVDYLNSPPTAAQLSTIIQQLGFVSARQLMRRNEDVYKTLQLDNPQLSEAQLLAAMIEHPKLIERPIAIFRDKAVIGRPPEAVMSIL